MRFELVDETKIKIAITKEDLNERDMKIVELAYGSDKAKDFFQEVMELAYEELGFDVNNIPILVEAIPVSLEEINIFVTKVTDPNELEKKIASMPEEKLLKQNIDIDSFRDKLEEAKENIFNDISKRKAIKLDSKVTEEILEQKPKSKDKVNKKENLTIFSFDSLDTAVSASKRIEKDTAFKSIFVLNNERFYLTIESKKIPYEEFEKVEEKLFEYGQKHISTQETKQMLLEHGEIIIKKDAINVLYKL